MPWLREVGWGSRRPQIERGLVNWDRPINNDSLSSDYGRSEESQIAVGQKNPSGFRDSEEKEKKECCTPFLMNLLFRIFWLIRTYWRTIRCLQVAVGQKNPLDSRDSEAKEKTKWRVLYTFGNMLLFWDFWRQTNRQRSSLSSGSGYVASKRLRDREYGVNNLFYLRGVGVGQI